MKLLEKLDCINDLSVKVKIIDKYVNKVIYYGSSGKIPYSIIRYFIYCDSIEHHYDYLQITVY